MRAIDLTGKVFGRLTVLSRNGSDKKGQSMFLCQCSCGKEITVQGYSMKAGDTKSCGCLKNEVVANGANTRHSMCGTRTYKSWAQMIQRCNNKNHKFYSNYGGRGVKVDPVWRDFSNFFADMGERPIGKSLDRVDNNGDYTASNCRWATRKEQANNKRTNRAVSVR